MFDADIIIDPTRWVFECKTPYIYEAPDFDGYYDLCGESFAIAMLGMREMPENDGTGKQMPIPSNDTGEVIRSILGGYNGATANFAQAHYVANQPISYLHGKAVEIYHWLIANEQRALIPIDNQNVVLEEQNV